MVERDPPEQAGGPSQMISSFQKKKIRRYLCNKISVVDKSFMNDGFPKLANFTIISYHKLNRQYGTANPSFSLSLLPSISLISLYPPEYINLSCLTSTFFIYMEIHVQLYYPNTFS